MHTYVTLEPQATWTAPDLPSVSFRTTVYDDDARESYIFTTTVYRKKPFAVAASISTKYVTYSGSIEAKGVVVISQVQTCEAVDPSTGSCSTSVTETARLTYHIEGLELNTIGGIHVRRMLCISRGIKKKKLNSRKFS